MRISKFKTAVDRRMLIALAAGIVTLFPLFWLWQGTSPSGPMTAKLHQVPFRIYLEALPVYTYCIFVYTLPFSLLAVIRSRLPLKMSACISAVAVLLYITYPVEASFIAKKDGFDTVGLLDKALTTVLGKDLIKHLFLLIFFLLGLLQMILFLKVLRPIHRTAGLLKFNIFYLIYIFLFVVGMLFNFQIWEKYFIQILPVCLVLTGQLIHNNFYHAKTSCTTSRDTGVRNPGT